MPYKDIDKRKEVARIACRKYYYANKEKYRCRSDTHRANLRSMLSSIRSENGCSYCGESHPSCLDFHHKNPAEKSFAIADCIRLGMSKESVLREIDKCIVLCANCHRKLHSS